MNPAVDNGRLSELLLIYGFHPEKMREIISTPPLDDQTFVRRVLEVLYDGQFDKLPFRCLRGIPSGLIEKNDNLYYRDRIEPVTPEKRFVLQKLYEKRLRGIASIISKEEIKKRIEAK